MDPSPHIFREYDIRGIVGEDLDAQVARSVGRAYATILGERTKTDHPRVVVGRDNRPSSPELARAFGDGVIESGGVVVDIGTVPTPVVYWAEPHLETHGGVVITGSHNPSEWNGIKLTMEGRALYGAGVKGLRDRIVSGTLRSGEGERSEKHVLDAYVEDLASRISLPGPVRVAVDCGNGTSSVVAVQLLEAIGCEVLPLYCESDGTFPNHHPDPTVDENLKDLVALVRREGAQVGIAFDGDGDRIGVVDDRGRVVRGDVLLLLFGLDLLDRRGKGQKLVFDVKCSQVLPQVYEEHGGEWVMWKTGHSLIKEKMREVGAPLAGELSGHICFADDYLGIDDALYAACRLAQLAGGWSRSVSEAVDELPRFASTPEIRLPVPEEDKVRIVEEALTHFRDRYEVIDVDGVRVLFGDGWGLLRASNTQPVLVARYEARSEERLREIRNEVEGWLAEQGVDV